MMEWNDLHRVAARLVAASTLVDIRLTSLEFNLDPEPGEGPYEVDAHFAVGAAATDGDLLIEIRTTIEAVPEEGANLFVIAPTFVSRYQYGEEEASEDEVQAFANTTALFAVYPYVREIVQSITSRAGLPVLTMELLKAQLVAETQDDQEPQRAAN